MLVGWLNAPYGNVMVKSDPGMERLPPLTPIVAETVRTSLTCEGAHCTAFTGIPFGSVRNPMTRITSPRRLTTPPISPESRPFCAVAGAAGGEVGKPSEQDMTPTAVTSRRSERTNLERIIWANRAKGWRCIGGSGVVIG